MADAVSVSDLDHLWDPKAKPLFTSKPPEWVATYLPRYCQSVSDRTDSDCRGLALAVRELNRDGFWRQLFPNWETCCLALFKRPAAWVEQVVEGVRVLHAHGHDGAVPLQLVIEQAKAQPLGEHRRPSLHEAVNKVDNVNFTEAKGGNSASYLLRRIARDQPELLDQIGPDKEFHSVRAAAIEAGIIKPVPTVRVTADMAAVASKLCQHLTLEQRIELIDLLAPDL
jgi:hypothetical protein